MTSQAVSLGWVHFNYCLCSRLFSKGSDANNRLLLRACFSLCSRTRRPFAAKSWWNGTEGWKGCSKRLCVWGCGWVWVGLRVTPRWRTTSGSVLQEPFILFIDTGSFLGTHNSPVQPGWRDLVSTSQAWGLQVCASSTKQDLVFNSWEYAYVHIYTDIHLLLF